MNSRIASSVCGDVGFAAMEVEDAREEEVVEELGLRVEDEMTEDWTEGFVDEEVGASGGWWRRRNLMLLPVRKQEMCEEVGGKWSMCLRYLAGRCQL